MYTESHILYFAEIAIVSALTAFLSLIQKGVEKNKLPEKTLKGFTLDCLKKCKWRNLANSVVGCFPFFNWIKAYQFREWFVGDLVSGLTVGIVHIPQSLLMVLVYE